MHCFTGRRMVLMRIRASSAPSLSRRALIWLAMVFSPVLAIADPFSQESHGVDTGVTDETTTVRSLSVMPFGVGERLVFSIDYGLINAGEAILEVVGTVIYQGKPCYRIESTATSNRFFSGIYRVRDKVVSYVDKERLYSRYFMKRLREGTFRRTEEIDFDHAAGKARYHDGKEYDITPNIHDVLSAFYFVRTLDLQAGKDIFLTVHDSRKTYELRVIVHRQQTVDTVLGAVDCFVVQPIMLGEGIFKHEGDLMIYLTADMRRIPVRMSTRLPVGNITANLRGFELSPIQVDDSG